MKVIKVGQASDVERGIAAYATVADRLMFEAPKAPCPAAMRSPSTGRSCPAARCRCRGCWPAGSRPDNVAEAVRVTGARRVDVSSGVESSRGVKSIDLIRAFLDRVKAL
jgi:phosphoribosylanthranilate isomerase